MTALIGCPERPTTVGWESDIVPSDGREGTLRLMIHMVVVATLVCLASWAGIAVGAGNVGLQRSVSMGPLTLLEQPLAIVLSTGLAFATTLALTSGRDVSRTDRWPLVAAVLVGDAIGALILAPVLIGELALRDAPVVFVVLATLGLQPIAVVVGRQARRRVAAV